MLGTRHPHKRTRSYQIVAVLYLRQSAAWFTPPFRFTFKKFSESVPARAVNFIVAHALARPLCKIYVVNHGANGVIVELCNMSAAEILYQCRHIGLTTHAVAQGANADRAKVFVSFGAFRLESSDSRIESPHFGTLLIPRPPYPPGIVWQALSAASNSSRHRRP